MPDFSTGDSKKKVICTLDSLFVKECNIIQNTIMKNYNKFREFLNISQFPYMDTTKILIALIERDEKNIVTWLGGDKPELLDSFEKITPSLYTDAPLTEILGVLQMLSFNRTAIDSVIVISDRKDYDIETACNVIFAETSIEIRYIEDIVEYMLKSEFDVFIDNDFDHILRIVEDSKTTGKSFILAKYAYNFKDFEEMVLKNGMTMEEFLITYGSEIGFMSPFEYSEDDKDYG